MYIKDFTLIRLSAPSFEVVKHIPQQQAGETEVDLLRIRSSEGNEMNIAIASRQVDLLRKGKWFFKK